MHLYAPALEKLGVKELEPRLLQHPTLDLLNAEIVGRDAPTAQTCLDEPYIAFCNRVLCAEKLLGVRL